VEPLRTTLADLSDFGAGLAEWGSFFDLIVDRELFNSFRTKLFTLPIDTVVPVSRFFKHRLLSATEAGS
jgi:hypothetical protein